MTSNKNAFKKIAQAAARLGDSKKADPVLVYDLQGRSPLADYAVLLGVESAPQLDAVEEEILVKLKHEGIYCLHKDGMRSRNWKVLDYGGTLIHIYDRKAEEFYAIGKVYADNKPVEWEEKPSAPPAPKKAPVKKAAAKPAKKAAKKPARKAARKPAKKAAKKPAGKTSKKK